MTSPQLTAEWENNLTQIAKGKADPAAFMEGIEDMARELVKTYPFLSDDKAQMFKPNGKCWEAAPLRFSCLLRERKTTNCQQQRMYLYHVEK